MKKGTVSAILTLIVTVGCRSGAPVPVRPAASTTRGSTARLRPECAAADRAMGLRRTHALALIPHKKHQALPMQRKTRAGCTRRDLGRIGCGSVDTAELRACRPRHERMWVEQ